MSIIPKSGFKGLAENWQSDMLAALSVSLVALPLGLGIAVASNVPPISGIIAAIIGGVVTTIFKGGHLTINGPTAGLIAVILSALSVLNDGTGQALNYVMAAVVVAGGIQVVLGLLRMGKLADIFHPSVIHGILAAIGIIIFAKQIHVALGTQSSSDHIIVTLIDAFKQIPNINPFIAIIALNGLVLLMFHSQISYRLFTFLPAPMWVLVIAIPFVYIFNYFEPHNIHLFGNEYPVGPHLLVNIPENLMDAVIFPNFSKIGTLPFWSSVLAITMIGSIESLAAAKAVDKLDPYKRKTNLNKDLIGTGLSTAVSGALGGLPVINVIIRSTVNIHNNAKTKWSNFYHGVFLIIFIFILAPVIQKVPLSALAILLVFTGFKLASPKVIKYIYNQGVEQLIFFFATLIITLFTNLFIGLFGGMVLVLITHFLLANVPIKTFFTMLVRADYQLDKESENNYKLKLKGIANFYKTIALDKVFNQVPKGANVVLDLSEARLVDLSMMENIHEFKRLQEEFNGSVKIEGLDEHISFTSHKYGLKLLTAPIRKQTPRQIKLREVAETHGWNFKDFPKNQTSYLETFYFFKSRPVDSRENCIYGNIEDPDWQIADVTFEEGEFLVSETLKSTLCLITFPFKIPKFTIEKKTFPEKYLNLMGHKDIDYVLYPEFSKKFVVKVDSIEETSKFISDELQQMLEESTVIHHLESNGEAVLMFTDNLKLAQPKDYLEIVELAKQLRTYYRKCIESIE